MECAFDADMPRASKYDNRLREIASYFANSCISKTADHFGLSYAYTRRKLLEAIERGFLDEEEYESRLYRRGNCRIPSEECRHRCSRAHRKTAEIAPRISEYFNGRDSTVAGAARAFGISRTQVFHYVHYAIKEGLLDKALYESAKFRARSNAQRKSDYRKVAEMRQSGATLAEIGRHFGITRERARQLVEKAIDCGLMEKEYHDFVSASNRKNVGKKVRAPRKALEAYFRENFAP